MGSCHFFLFIRFLFSALLLIALLLFYILLSLSSSSSSSSSSCEQAAAQLNPCSLSPNLTTSFNPGSSLFISQADSNSSDIHWRYNFKSYEEYVQLQLKKTTNIKLRKVWLSKEWQRKVELFKALFERLMSKEGLIKPGMKGLCIGARVGQEVLALRQLGLKDSLGIDLVPSPPLVVAGDMHKHPFQNDTFDFEFSNVFDHALFPLLFVSEIERTLKPGAIAVIHLLVKGRADKYSANDLNNLDAFLSLFKQSDVVHVKDVDLLGLDTEVAFRKRRIPALKVTAAVTGSST